jgi:hypothetical protein
VRRSKQSRILREMHRRKLQFHQSLIRLQLLQNQMRQKWYNDISIVTGRPRHPFNDALSRWMEENETDDWKMEAYMVDSKINEHL